MLSAVLDGDGLVLRANHAAVEGCGLLRVDVIGYAFWDCGWWSSNSDVAAEVRGWCEHALASGQSTRGRSAYFLGDGTPRTVDLSVQLIHDDLIHDDPADDARHGSGSRRDSYLIVTAVDITDALSGPAEREERLASEAAGLRAAIAARERALVSTQLSERRAEDRLQRLADVALELITAETIEDVTETVVQRGLPVLGADGGAVVLRDEHGLLRATVSNRLSEKVQLTYAVLSADSRLPGPHVTRTGQRLVLANRAAGNAFSPEMAKAFDLMQRNAMVTTPLKLGNRVFGALSAAWVEERDFSNDELALIDVFAAQCAQALERIEVTRMQRETMSQVQRLAEALQRSLLTQPPTPDALEIAVRYQPAAQEAQVGGDWYDAFVTAAGDTVLVIGDVTGHDRMAAAAMGQVRNVLRGVAYDSNDSPAVVLSRLDRALLGLEVGTMVTAIVARVEQDPNDEASRQLRWSNAGHLPPLLLQPDGEVRILSGSNDLLLGIDPGTNRGEQVIELPEGSTLLLYTDGLIERRGTDIDDQIAILARLLHDFADADPDRLCDGVLAALAADNEDDVAILVLRCGPQRQRPHERRRAEGRRTEGT
jgi:serine phosphatase RsbU (regulator of sigma subunit)